MGELDGCIESLDAGVTCVIDHAHMNYGAWVLYVVAIFGCVFAPVIRFAVLSVSASSSRQLCFGKRTAPCQASICRLEL